MVCGSESESAVPRSESKNKSKYDGTVKQWQTGEIKLKSILFNKGLWEVVEKGPTATGERQTSPASVTLRGSGGDAGQIRPAGNGSIRGGTVPCRGPARPRSSQESSTIDNISLNEVLIRF
jgi:hypothetical protein